MITTNVIQRTFFIKWDDSQGTAFTIERGSKQYLITARHVVEGIKSGAQIEVFHEKQWKNLAIDVVGVGEGEMDIAILACEIQLSPLYPLEPSSANLCYGQQVYFLGFPFGWESGHESINRGFPIPFVKAGINSAFIQDPVQKFYIDAHVNEGFSGGPLVFIPDGQPKNQNTEYHVAGVVVNYPTPRYLPIVDWQGSPIIDKNNQPIGHIRENPGLVVAINIRHATDLIDSNPVGFKLPLNQSNP